jgi:predicted ATP-grasp superfamily ATP-dependent carboligase
MRSREIQRRNGPVAVVLNVSLAGLGAMQSLGRAGVPVTGLDPDTDHAGFVSRYGHSLKCPHPMHEPDQLAEFLIDLGKRLDQPGIISPASDAFVLFVSRYREVLREYFRFNVSPAQVMEAALDKRKLYDLAANMGYAHATTLHPKTMDDVHQIKHDLAYPVFLKPYYSHMWVAYFPGAGKGIKVFSAEELVSSFQKIFPTNVEVMVQEIIAGPASNVQTVYVYLTRDGEPLGLVTTRKIRQFPIEFGRGSLAETFHDQEFAKFGLTFFRGIGYRGFGTIEFKRDDRDGLLKVTDLNPRWVKPINLPTAAGVDFPLIHYLDLAGERPSPRMEFKAGVRWWDAISDLATSWSMYRSGDLSPWSWARSCMGARAFPAFALDDLTPFLHEYDYGRRLLRAPLKVLGRR